EIYYEAVRHPDIAALSIARRPDCLGDDVLKLIEEINRVKPVFVELGLQTIHRKSAEYIRRGYPLEVYNEALERLNALQIHTVTHIILGLPDESREDMLESVKYVCDRGTKGIKLQLLHILDGTDLADEYRQGKVKEMGFDEYVALIRDCIRIIPEDVVIHRLTGDGDKKTLIAPLWSADKKRVLNAINKAIKNEVE
ncbi:MAG: TIGR01212 family radical SAM protein, partial [Eubacterium sp.]|nr:TIGR01212 family radical SAM protein [Eubacterium sp.]